MKRVRRGRVEQKNGSGIAEASTASRVDVLHAQGGKSMERNGSDEILDLRYRATGREESCSELAGPRDVSTASHFAPARGLTADTP